MTVAARSPAELIAPGRPLTLAGVANGAEGLVVADLARAVAARADAPTTSLLVICRDGPRMAALARSLAFFAPELAVLEFPSWDCLPYDRVSPHAGWGMAAQGAFLCLALLAAVNAVWFLASRGLPLLTRSIGVTALVLLLPSLMLVGALVWTLVAAPLTVVAGWHHALAQLNIFPRFRCASRATMRCAAASSISMRPAWPSRCGSTSSATRSKPSAASIRTQRTTDQLRGLDLVPVPEFQLTSETIRRFRLGYVEAFGAPTPSTYIRRGERGPPSWDGTLAATATTARYW
jgi:transcription-repair coupling factor (superfamily II helicase)